MNSVKNILRARASVAHKLELDLHTIKSLKRMHAGNRGNAGLMATLEEIRKVEARVGAYRARINAFNFCLQDAEETTAPSKASSKPVDMADTSVIIADTTKPPVIKAGKVPSTHRDRFIAHRDIGKDRKAVSIQGTIRNLVTTGYTAGKPYKASDILADLRRMDIIPAGSEGVASANAAHTAIRKLAKVGTIAKATDGTLVTIQPAS